VLSPVLTPVLSFLSSDELCLCIHIVVDVEVVVVRLLERLAGVVSRRLTVEQLSVVKAILSHIITRAENNSSR